MSFATMIADVQDITTRPDSGVLPLIKRAIKEALREMHSIAKFSRDLKIVDAGFAYDASGKFTASFPLQYRRLHRLVLAYPDGTELSDFEEQILGVPTRFEQPLAFYYRILGNGITLSYVGQPSNLKIEYLAYPLIDTALQATDSFIADTNDTAIVYLAAAKVFHAIGDDTAMRTYLQLAETQKMQLIQNFEAI